MTDTIETYSLRLIKKSDGQIMYSQTGRREKEVRDTSGEDDIVEEKRKRKRWAHRWIYIYAWCMAKFVSEIILIYWYAGQGQFLIINNAAAHFCKRFFFHSWIAGYLCTASFFYSSLRGKKKLKIHENNSIKLYLGEAIL